MNYVASKFQYFRIKYKQHKTEYFTNQNNNSIREIFNIITDL